MANDTFKAAADFLYQDDLPTDHLRLMQWQKSSLETDDTLYFSLTTCHLDQAPRYVALSYRWSDPDATRPEATIVCNGVRIHLGPTLYDGLVQLSSCVDKSLYLWVDFICIEQANEDEKQRQVLLMPRIYQGSHRVIIWLGPSSTETEQAIDLLLYYMDIMDAVDESLKPDSKKSLSATESCVHELIQHAANYPPPPVFEEMARFFRREWFGRVWTLQEAALASDACVVVFGNRSMPYSRLVHLAQRYANGGLDHWTSLVRMIRFRTQSESINPGNPPRSSMLHLKTVLKMRKALKLHTVSPKTSRPVIRLLDYLRPFESSDPRDRIFAAAAFLPPQLIVAIRDQGLMSVERLYTVFGTVELGTYHNIQCLAAAGLSQHRRSYPQRYGTTLVGTGSHLPSWVPDWAYRKVREALWVLSENLMESQGQPLYRATGDSSSSVSVGLSSHGDPMAVVAGSVTDTIVACGKPYRIHSLPVGFVAEQDPKILLEHYRSYQGQVNGYVALGLRHLEPEKMSSTRSIRSLTLIRKTLIGNMMPVNPGTTMDGLWGKARLEQIDPMFDAMDESIMELQHTCDQKERSEEQQQQQQNLSIHELELRDAQRQQELERRARDIIAAGRASEMIASAHPAVPSIKPFSTLSVATMCKGRNFFVTRGGKVGVGPDILQQDDRICLIHGACTPFVIRPRDPSQGVHEKKEQHELYELVGECYVEGLMDGQGMMEGKAEALPPEYIHLI